MAVGIIFGSYLVRDTQIAKRLLMKLMAYDELEEKTMMLLMKGLALQKNKEALTQQFIQFTQMLDKELGISPSLEITALYSHLMTELDPLNTDQTE
jgi:two-component system LytT family response regulator